MNRVFQCPRCHDQWPVPDPGHNQPVMAVCACPRLVPDPWNPVVFQVMTEITPLAAMITPHIALQVIRTEPW